MKRGLDNTLLGAAIGALFGVLVSCGPGSQPDSPPSPAAIFKKAPYLIYSGDNGRMTVLWQATAAVEAWIRWGTDQTYGSGAARVPSVDPDHFYRRDLTGLTPGRKYFYRVELPEREAVGSFVAAPAADGPASLFLYGDTRTEPAAHDLVAAAMVSAYAADPALQGIVLHAGDLVTDGQVAQTWDEEFFNPWYRNVQRLLAGVPLQAAMGNHEGDGLLFTRLFPYPFADGHYWSFDYGAVHLAVIDQYAAGGVGAGQLAWLAADLASTTRPWKIILLHQPGWSAGGGHENDIGVQTDIQPLAKLYGAMVVAGHNHYYARAEVDGVTHITTGGGGAPLHDPIMSSPGVLIAEKAYHFCVIRATADTLQFRAVRLDGSEIDSFTLAR